VLPVASEVTVSVPAVGAPPAALVPSNTTSTAASAPSHASAPAGGPGTLSVGATLKLVAGVTAHLKVAAAPGLASKARKRKVAPWRPPSGAEKLRPGSGPVGSACSRRS
jgi:hypothetical protein